MRERERDRGSEGALDEEGRWSGLRSVAGVRRGRVFRSHW